MVGCDVSDINRATSMICDWVANHPKHHKLINSGTCEHFTIYQSHQSKVAHLERCDLQEFEEWLRRNIPLFDGKISLQDVNHLTAQEFDEVRTLESILYGKTPR